MPKLALTQSRVNKACCIDEKKTDYFDTNLKNFALEVRPNKSRSYFIRYNDARGKKRQLTIGDATLITLADARKKAREWLREIELGRDPRAEKQARRSAPTVLEFAENYLDYVRTRKKSWRTDYYLLHNHVLPLIGSTHLDTLTTSDFLKLQKTVYDKGLKPATNDRIIILCRYMMNLAIEWGDFGITTNPTQKVKLFHPNNKMERFLSEQESHALVRVLDAPEHATLRPIIMLGILTGARRGEILQAEWRHVDLDSANWLIPETKAGRPRTVPLNDYAVAMLAELKSKATTKYVCPNPRTGEPYKQFYYRWHRIRVAAGVPELRFHDLRHTYASALINGSRSLYEVQHLLGHTKTRTTERYAHLTHETLRDACQAIGPYLPQPPTTNTTKSASDGR